VIKGKFCLKLFFLPVILLFLANFSAFAILYSSKRKISK